MKAWLRDKINPYLGEHSNKGWAKFFHFFWAAAVDTGSLC